MPDFAALSPQDVREHWTDEEHDFTPWLADQLQDDEVSGLEDELGLDLTVRSTEKHVGRYKLDILAEVTDTGSAVVIENQLSASDHDHLGKALAYAAGEDADIIVWIGPEFHDEHLDAMRWLNDKSREEVDLFAVRIEVWRIEDSKPAVRFNPIVEPSEWKDKAQRSPGEVSELGELREEFWTEFRDRIEASSTAVRPRSPTTRHYYTNPIGKSGFHIAYSHHSRSNELRLDLIIEDDEGAFETLYDDIDELESELGTELAWEEPHETRGDNMRSHFRVKRDVDLEARDRWDEYFDWMLTYGDRFHEVFRPRLQALD